MKAAVSRCEGLPIPTEKESVEFIVVSTKTGWGVWIY